MYLVLKRFLYYSLPNLESQRKNSQNLQVANWFSPRLVRIWRNKRLCLHYFTLNNVLQHQPKLVNAGLQSSSIFPVLILWNCDFVQKFLAQLLTPKIQLWRRPSKLVMISPFFPLRQSIRVKSKFALTCLTYRTEWKNFA